MKKLLVAITLLTVVSVPTSLFAQNRMAKGTKGGVAVDSARHSNHNTMNARTAPSTNNSGNSTPSTKSPKKAR